MPMSYLLELILPLADEALIDRVAKVAVCFLEMKGAVQDEVIGVYQRAARRANDVETLYLVSLKLPTVAANEVGDVALARKIERNLRSMLAEGGSPRGRVTVRADVTLAPSLEPTDRTGGGGP
jgi:hypothetical protein